MKRVCCDVCLSASNYPMSKDKRIKEIFGADVDVCLDCSAWLDDRQIYERLFENDIICEDTYEELIKILDEEESK